MDQLLLKLLDLLLVLLSLRLHGLLEVLLFLLEGLDLIELVLQTTDVHVITEATHGWLGSALQVEHNV